MQAVSFEQSGQRIEIELGAVTIRAGHDGVNVGLVGEAPLTGVRVQWARQRLRVQWLLGEREGALGLLSRQHQSKPRVAQLERQALARVHDMTVGPERHVTDQTMSGGRTRAHRGAPQLSVNATRPTSVEPVLRAWRTSSASMSAKCSLARRNMAKAPSGSTVPQLR
jgi:hypothetical protein